MFGRYLYSRKQSENFSEEKAPVNDSQCQEILAASNISNGVISLL